MSTNTVDLGCLLSWHARWPKSYLSIRFEVLRELRGDRLHATLPVIAVSGQDTGFERARRDPEFFAALRKPFDPDDLIGVTRRAALRPYRSDSV